MGMYDLHNLLLLSKAKMPFKTQSTSEYLSRGKFAIIAITIFLLITLMMMMMMVMMMMTSIMIEGGAEQLTLGTDSIAF